VSARRRYELWSRRDGRAVASELLHAEDAARLNEAIRDAYGGEEETVPPVEWLPAAGAAPGAQATATGGAPVSYAAEPAGARVVEPRGGPVTVYACTRCGRGGVERRGPMNALVTSHTEAQLPGGRELIEFCEGGAPVEQAGDDS
jgi:hypothetical protein